MPIDAALHSGSKSYFFRGDQYVRVSRSDAGPGTPDPGYPKPISTWNWPNNFGTNGIDAALHSGTKTYFFSGNQYIRVTRDHSGAGTQDPGYPKPVSTWNWPNNFGASGIDAALHSGTKTYFFSGDQYIRVTRGDAGAGTPDTGYPKPVSTWNWPNNFGTNGIDAALHSGTKTYFFSGDQYIRVTRGNAGAGTPDTGYPKPISIWNWPNNFGMPTIVRKAVSSAAAATDVATYAAGVAMMRARSVVDQSDPLGWDYFSHIHGYPGANGPIAGDPPDWSTCQHGTWFFVAWHRMYLRQLERVIRSETGVQDFALPYWDYANAAALTAIPPAFADATSALFDSTRNFRPFNPGAPSWKTTQTYAAFGGAIQSKNHVGGLQGQLESNPHNPIHGMVGGNMAGFQSPLDPIFYIHHCNIDRFAEVWLGLPGRANPSDSSYLNSTFEFPDPDTPNQRRTMAVSTVATVADAGYSYDDVSAAGFALSENAESTPSMTGPRKDDRLQLLAATSVAGRVTERVQIEAPAALDTSGAFDAAESDAPAEFPLYLVLENVGIDGGDASAMWHVYVHIGDTREQVGIITPFGLAGLTAQGGSKTMTFDITHLAARLGAEPIEVTFEPVYDDVEFEPYWERTALYTTEP